MRIIKSITEAFGTQPRTLELADKNNRSPTKPENDIARIVSERKQVTENENKWINVVVGYNFSGEKLFEYIESAVHIHYVSSMNLQPDK